MPPLRLDMPVKFLKGIGERRAEALQKLGISTAQDLLWHLPHRYVDASAVTPLIKASVGADVACVGRVVAKDVLPTRKGLRIFRRLVDRHLDGLVALCREILPEDLRLRFSLPALPEALRAVHRPASVAEAERGRRRLALDELLDLQLMLGRARHLAKRGRVGVQFEVKRQLTTALKDALPWTLTADQKQALREITADMTAPDRMHRLLMGDVGTGKTVVALFAMLLAVENDYQAAVMAPTELLAARHRAAPPRRRLGPRGGAGGAGGALKPDLLIGRLSATEKAATRERIAAGASRL